MDVVECMCVCVCVAGKRGRLGHESKAIYPPLSPADWKNQQWWPKIWINLQQGTSIVLTVLVCLNCLSKQVNLLVFLILAVINSSCVSLLSARTNNTWYKLNIAWLKTNILEYHCPLIEGTGTVCIYDLCHAVPQWKQRSPVEHVERFTRPSGVNGSALEERERGLIQHSAQDSLQ